MPPPPPTRAPRTATSNAYPRSSPSSSTTSSFSRPRRGGGGGGGGGSQPVNLDPSHYTSYDDAIDAGVESEERGERHAIGPKAQRFFEQAYRLYVRAASLPSPSSRADAIYNAARVQYLLATSFYLPPHAIAVLADSVALFKAALIRAPLPANLDADAGTDADAGVPSPFSLDVVSNLATALQTLGELVDELGWLDQQVVQVQTLAPLTDYAAIQTVGPTPPPGTDPRLPTPAKLLHEAVDLFRLAAAGQERVLIDQLAGEAHNDEPSAGGEDMVDDDADADADAEAAAEPEAHQDDEVGYTSSLVTVDAYVDTQLSVYSCLSTLLASCDTTAQAGACATGAIEALDRAAAALLPDARLPPLDEGERTAKGIEVQRARLSLRVGHAARLADLSPSFPSADEEGEVAQLEQALLDWSASLLAAGAERGGDTATLCELGDNALALTRLRLRIVRRSPSPPPLAGIEQAWALGTTTSRLYNAALSTLSSGSAGAVLGSAGTSTAASRQRGTILSALAATSLVRASPVFEASSLGAAAGTRAKLVENARAYARKAVVEFGLGWILTAEGGGRRGGGATQHTHAHGGWDTASKEAEASFVLLRSLFWRGVVATISGDTERAAQSEVECRTVLSHLATLAQQREGGYALAFASSVYAASGTSTTAGVDRFLADLRAEEGDDAVDADELTFWNHCRDALAGGRGV